MTKSGTVAVSIVIPVRNNAVRLEQCIRAVLRECANRNDVEVIVVDNGSTDGSRAVAERFGIYTRLANSSVSPYLARNQGVEIARGEIIVLLDSNCIPATGWLSNGLRIVRSGTHIATAVFQFDPLKTNQYAARFDAIYSVIRKPKTGGITALPCTNLFIDQRVFSQVGPFDDRRRSLEDIDWTRRAYTAGFNLGIAEQSFVRYPAKGGLRFLKKMFRLGRGKKEQALVSGRYYTLRYVGHCFRQFLPPAPKFVRTMYQLGREEELFVPWLVVILLCYVTKLSRGLGMILSKVNRALYTANNPSE